MLDEVGNGLWVLSLSVGGGIQSPRGKGESKRRWNSKRRGGCKGRGFQGVGDKFELLSLKE